MNEQQTEMLSALMDGESVETDETVLQHLVRNEAARRVWARYHLISDCLRRELPLRVDPGFAQRIAGRLRDEPTLLIPEKTISRPWLKPLAGIAIAASVAIVAIIGIQSQSGSSGARRQAAVDVASVSDAVAARQFTLASGNSVQSNVAVREQQQRAARLNRYLVHYNEYRSNAAVQGMLPYARIVVHEENQ